jgi:proline iminopeptidase
MRSVVEDQQLFPPQEPRATMRLDVGDGHLLYVEECGNPDGIPVVFLHGGPGAGCNPVQRRLFDPELFRVILFDQRGSGQSRPFGSIEHNTTPHLIADIELIRQYFGIERWIIFGGSWGSTLGLIYGITHPERCLGFVLRGIFLGTKAEIDWFLYDMGKFFPEAWDRFIHAVPENERHDLLENYFKRLVSDNPALSIMAAESWSAYENSCSTLRAELRGGGGRMAVSLATLEAHYFRHHCFIKDGFIVDQIERIVHLPAVVVQGRHDVICPPISASNLVKAWPQAELKIVDNAGHSALEPEILQQLLSGLRGLANRLLS